MTDANNKIKIFGSDDDLKSLGELLSNETSRKIIKNLMENQMYTNEIATKLDMRVSLVIHHLKKMESLGLLEITDKKIKRKGEKHRFFTMNSDIFVTLDKTKEDFEKKGILKRIFRDGIKVTAVGIASFIAWSTTLLTDPQRITFASQEEINLTIPLLIIILGLVANQIFTMIKKRKKS